MHKNLSVTKRQIRVSSMDADQVIGPASGSGGLVNANDNMEIVQANKAEKQNSGFVARF